MFDVLRTNDIGFFPHATPNFMFEKIARLRRNGLLTAGTMKLMFTKINHISPDRKLLLKIHYSASNYARLDQRSFLYGCITKQLSNDRRDS